MECRQVVNLLCVCILKHREGYDKIFLLYVYNRCVEFMYKEYDPEYQCYVFSTHHPLLDQNPTTFKLNANDCNTLGPDKPRYEKWHYDEQGNHGSPISPTSRRNFMTSMATAARPCHTFIQHLCEYTSWNEITTAMKHSDQMMFRVCITQYFPLPESELTKNYDAT